MYQAKLSNYEGPLDLLLRLIEQSKLDVTNIALAQVTQQYLSYVESLSAIDPLELGRFTDLAAKLIHIKSLALLPDQISTLEVESADLAARLSEYRQYQQAASTLAGRIHDEHKGFERPAVPRPAPDVLPGAITAQMLEQAFQTALSRLEPTIDEDRLETTISFEVVFDDVSLRLRRTPSVSLGSLIEEATSRLEIVMIFLVILELARSKQVSLCQDQTFGDIMVTNEPEP